MKDNSNPDINFNDDRSAKASNLYIYMYIYIYGPSMLLFFIRNGIKFL